MTQQLSPKVGLGTGFPPKNNVGAWAELIDVIEFESRWAMIAFFFTTGSFGNLNLELGVGPLGEEVRKWKSIGTFINLFTADFDDPLAVRYVPFTFRKDDRVSARVAGINQSFGHGVEIQLQIFS